MSQRVEEEWGRLEERQVTAARKIQAMVRGHFVRMRMQRLLLTHQSTQLQSSLLSLQRDLSHLRLSLGFTVQHAALTIQKHVRGHQIRKKIRDLVVKNKEYWESVRNKAVLVIQTWFRRKIEGEVYEEMREKKEIMLKLAVIRRKLALLTIKKLLHEPIIAYRLQKQKVIRKKQRKMARLEAITRLKSETLPVIPANQSAAEEMGDTMQPELSEASEVVVSIQPIGRHRCRLSLPTVSFQQYSSNTVVLRPLPKAPTLSPHPRTRFTRTSASPRRHRGRYMLSTESSQYRSERSSVEERIHIPPASIKPPPERILQPTEAWKRFTSLRKELFVGLTSQVKPPLWRYSGRNPGLDSVPSTPLTSLRDSATPGNSTRRHLLSSQMVRPREDLMDTQREQQETSLSMIL